MCAKCVLSVLCVLCCLFAFQGTLSTKFAEQAGLAFHSIISSRAARAAHPSLQHVKDANDSSKFSSREAIPKFLRYLHSRDHLLPQTLAMRELPKSSVQTSVVTVIIIPPVPAFVTRCLTPEVVRSHSTWSPLCCLACQQSSRVHHAR